MRVVIKATHADNSIYTFSIHIYYVYARERSIFFGEKNLEMMETNLMNVNVCRVYVEKLFTNLYCFVLCFSFLDKVAIVKQPDYTPTEQVIITHTHTHTHHQSLPFVYKSNTGVDTDVTSRRSERNRSYRDLFLARR